MLVVRVVDQKKQNQCKGKNGKGRVIGVAGEILGGRMCRVLQKEASRE
jgi:hypothetical protein